MDKRIRSLRPNVTEAEALAQFSSAGISSLYRRIRLGPLQRLAAVYVPFRAYRVNYEMARAPQSRLFFIDAVDGTLDLFEFAEPPAGDKLIEVETKNYLAPALSEELAASILREKALRVIFAQGMFKLKPDSLEISREPSEIFMPYWLAFYGAPTRLHCRAIDAVRRRIEGAKATAFFEKWIAEKA